MAGCYNRTLRTRVLFIAVFGALVFTALFSGCAHGPSDPSISDSAQKVRRKKSPVSVSNARRELRYEITSEVERLATQEDKVPVPANAVMAATEFSQAAAEVEKTRDKFSVATVAELPKQLPPKIIRPREKSSASLGLARAGPPDPTPTALLKGAQAPSRPLKKLDNFSDMAVELSAPSDTPLIFDIPITYNARVKHWLKFFQTNGRSWFKIWLERSTRFLPLIQHEFEKAGLPQDLAYVAMIESGFSSHAVSHADAVGMWQFIVPTGRQYGLRSEWWIDERKDYFKSTVAAIRYMQDLYRQFQSWYLVAASYNMGETRVRRLIKRHDTNNFWKLADMGVLSDETTNYVPKILAAMLISKAPALYGFRNLQFHLPQAYEYFHVPGGTDLVNLAKFLGVSAKYLRELNPELIRGFVPRGISGHKIRIPKGSMLTVSQYVRLQMDSAKN